MRIGDAMNSYRTTATQGRQGGASAAGSSNAPQTGETGKTPSLWKISDSVIISGKAGAAGNLGKGRLSSSIDVEEIFGREVTDAASDPRLIEIEKGVREIKSILDDLGTLTELAQSGEITAEDRYDLQIAVVDLEGRLEKKVYEMQNRYAQLTRGTDPEGGGAWMVDDRTSGEVEVLDSYIGVIDKRTAMKKEMIHRIHLRKLDPESYDKYLEAYRQRFRQDFEAMWGGETAGQAMKPEPEQTFESSRLGMDFEGVRVEDPGSTEPPEDAYVYMFRQPVSMADDREFEALRFSVMSPSQAAESNNRIRDITERLAVQFLGFAKSVEKIAQIDDVGQLEKMAQNHGEAAMAKKLKDDMIDEAWEKLGNFLERTVLGKIPGAMLLIPTPQTSATAAEAAQTGTDDLDEPGGLADPVETPFVKVSLREIWRQWRADKENGSLFSGQA